MGDVGSNRCSGPGDLAQKADCLCSYLTDSSKPDESLAGDCKRAVMEISRVVTNFCLDYWDVYKKPESEVELPVAAGGGTQISVSVEKEIPEEQEDDAKELCDSFSAGLPLSMEFKHLPDDAQEKIHGALGGMGYSIGEAELVYKAIREGKKFPLSPLTKSKSQVKLKTKRAGIKLGTLTNLLWIKGAATILNFYVQVGGEASLYVYFEKGIYASLGARYLFAPGNGVNLHNVDGVVKAGYLLDLPKNFGLLFYAGADIGYQFSYGPYLNSCGQCVNPAAFYAAVDAGVEAQCSFGKWHLTFGTEYSRTLECEKRANIPLNSLFFTIGFEIDVIKHIVDKG